MTLNNDQTEIAIKESDLICLILEFLHKRGLSSSALSLEKETSIDNINNSVPHELKSVRLLLINGQFTKVLSYLKQYHSKAGFIDIKRCIVKHHYMELMYRYEFESTNQQLMESIKNELAFLKQKMADLSIDDTCIEDLSDFDIYGNRINCFEQLGDKLYFLIENKSINESDLTASSNNAIDFPIQRSQNDRLLQLIVKGLLYEACIDYCQAAATTPVTHSSINHQLVPPLLDRRTFSNLDISLLSWLYALPPDTFVVNFPQRRFFVNVKHLPPKSSVLLAESVQTSDINAFSNGVVNNITLSSSSSGDATTKPTDNERNKNHFTSTSSSYTKSYNDNRPVLSSTASPPLVSSNHHYQYRKIAHLEDVQAIRAIDIHPSGHYLAIGSNSRMLRICKWPEITSKSLHDTDSVPLKIIGQAPKHHIGSIFCVAWHPKGNLIASGSNDKQTKLIGFDPDCAANNMSPLGPTVELDNHQGTIRDVCFLTDQNSVECSMLLSAGAGDCHIMASDITAQKSYAIMSGHSMPVFSLTSLSSFEFISSGQDGKWCLWDIRLNYKLVHSVEVDTTLIASVHSANAAGIAGVRQYLTSGHSDGSVRLWDLRRLTNTNDNKVCIARSADTHTNEIRSVRFKPNSIDSQKLGVLSASYDNFLALTNFQLSSNTYSVDYTWQDSFTVAKHFDKAVTARWHPQHNAFASSSADKTCVVWSAIA
ncbi:hypothetical protein GJ496_011318 [Pomphorhynchus laevis]|nr:hypothetical protein GJ496_011318 [Pomphorhynchus laevis]